LVRNRNFMNDEVTKMIELRGLPQSACDLRRRLKAMDNRVRGPGRGDQAIDAVVVPTSKITLASLATSLQQSRISSSKK
jgi:hypothetical protein